MKPALLLVLLFSSALPAHAQLDDATPTQASTLLEKERGQKEKDEQPLTLSPTAQAIALAFGPETWAKVQISTNGPAVDLTRLVASGHYKLELIELVLLASRAGVPLKDIMEKRDKGAKGKKPVSLKDLASQNGQDHDQLYEAALAVEALVDREYLPRFVQPRLKKER